MIKDSDKRDLLFDCDEILWRNLTVTPMTHRPFILENVLSESNLFFIWKEKLYRETLSVILHKSLLLLKYPWFGAFFPVWKRGSLGYVLGLVQIFPFLGVCWKSMSFFKDGLPMGPMTSRRQTSEILSTWWKRECLWQLQSTHVSWYIPCSCLGQEYRKHKIWENRS